MRIEKKTMKKAALLLSFLAIILFAGKLLPPLPSNVSAEQSGGRWYKGFNHTHTTHSDGANTVEELVEEAVAMGLDFLMITDHGNRDAKQETDMINIPGFLAMAGMEGGGATPDGYSCHTLYYDCDVPKAKGIQEQINIVNSQGGIAFLAHPFAYIPATQDYIPLIDFLGLEVWNGYQGAPHDDTLSTRAFKWWDDLNKAGRHILGITGTDAHNIFNFCRPENPRLVIYMEELTEEEFYRSLRKGCYYGSNGPEIQFDIAGFMMGGDYMIPCDNAPVTISVGGSYTQEIKRVELLVNGEVEKVWTPNATSFSDMYTINVSDGDFVRFTVECEQKRFAFSNPIWFYKEFCDTAKVSELIDDIPDNVGMADKAKVELARTAYNALFDSEKSGVTNYQKLTDAETALKEIERVNPVIAAIDDIPQEPAYSDGEKIAAARAAYNGLTLVEKQKITNYSKLRAAEAAFALLERLKPVIDAIDDIPGAVRVADAQKIEQARAAYNDLPFSEKAKVTNYSKLCDAEAALNKLMNVVNKIDAIPEQPSRSDKPKVTAARAAYDALTAEEKEKVTNFNKLKAAEEKLGSLMEEEEGSSGCGSELPVFLSIGLLLCSMAACKARFRKR